MSPPCSPVSRACRRASRVCIAALTATIWFCAARGEETEPSSSDAPAFTTAVRVSEGPWGKIESYPIVVEPPETHLWGDLYDERSLWNFGSRSREESISILTELGFAEATLSLVGSRGIWTQETGETIVEVDDETIESLSPENRTSLARWFRLNQPTFFGKQVVNIEGGESPAIKEGAIRPETAALIQKMIFRRSQVYSLMDRAYILRKLGDDAEEKKRFVRAIFSTRSLMVRLIIDETTDLDSVAAYWSAGGRNNTASSILRAIAATTGLERVDLIQILPPVPRRYINSFADLRDVSPTSAPDCFWTAIQFFSSTTSSRILDGLTLEHHIGEDFEPVHGEPAFGDLICMFNVDDDTFLHSYVHIADDIVFTKNGASFARPFVLTRKSDMLSLYLDEARIRVESYRRKPKP